MATTVQREFYEKHEAPSYGHRAAYDGFVSGVRMSALIMEPSDALDRLTDLCMEAKGVIKEAKGDDLGTIEQIFDLLLFEIAVTLARIGGHSAFDADEEG